MGVHPRPLMRTEGSEREEVAEDPLVDDHSADDRRQHCKTRSADDQAPYEAVGSADPQCVVVLDKEGAGSHVTLDACAGSRVEPVSGGSTLRIPPVQPKHRLPIRRKRDAPLSRFGSMLGKISTTKVECCFRIEVDR